MADKMTWDDVNEVMTSFLGYKAQGAETNGSLYQLTYSFSSNAGRDVSFTLQCDKDNPYSVSEAMNAYAKDFNADEMVASIYEEEKENGVSIRDAFKDAEEVRETLKGDSVILNQFVENFDYEYSRDEIKKTFENFLENETGNVPVETKDAVDVCKRVTTAIIYSPSGSPRQKTELLRNYLKELGINDKNPETYAKALNNVQAEHKARLAREKETGIPTKIEGRLLSSTESKVIRMFDSLFSKYLDETNPRKYVEEYVIPAHYEALENSTNDVWWKGAVDHAVNSGGLMWQPTYERMQLFEKFGLIPEGTCAKDESNKDFNREWQVADKKYARYMYDYLSLKGLTDDKKRLEVIKKDRERAAKRSRSFEQGRER